MPKLPLSMRISPMNASFSSLHTTLGMQTFSSTFVHKISGLTSLNMTIDAFTIRLLDTSSSEIFSTDEGSITSFGNVLSSTKLTESWMIATTTLAVVTSQVCLSPKKAFEQYTLFHDCIHAVKRCDKCQLYANKAQTPPILLHLVITIDPFWKWGIDFMTLHPPYNNGHKYIVVVVYYFTKCA